jgi:hypothetical protein
VLCEQTITASTGQRRALNLFVVLINDLNVQKTGIGEELAMLLGAQERHPCSVGTFFRKPGSHRVRPFVHFRDDDELAF